MTSADFIALLPILVLTGATIAVMLAIAVRRSHTAAFAITLAGLATTFALLWPAASAAPRQVTPLLVIDTYALFYTGLIAAATFAVAILCYVYFERHDVRQEEMYVLLLSAALGAVVLVSSSHFVSFFLGLEILSIPLYVMNAYLRERKRSLEAGLKYLVLAASSAAFLLFGMALVYGAVGTMFFPEMAARLAGAVRSVGSSPLVLSGLALIVVGIGFKLAVVPFHLWTPDVYEGAPAPVTAFVATVSKGGMFGLLLRYFYQSGARNIPSVVLVFSIIAIASMIAGNILALRQNNVKRLLAYSSIAHLGYILVAFLAGGREGATAVTFYLVAYFVTTLGVFAVIALLSNADRDSDNIEDYRGLFWRRPVTACIFTAMLLSLAGIPLTAGFVGKFFIVTAGASSALWATIIVMVVTSGIGVFYYLRVVLAIFEREPVGTEAVLPAVSGPGGFVLWVLTGLLVWLGVYPAPLLAAIRAAVSSIG